MGEMGGLGHRVFSYGCAQYRSGNKPGGSDIKGELDQTSPPDVKRYYVIKRYRYRHVMPKRTAATKVDDDWTTEIKINKKLDMFNKRINRCA